MGIFIPVDHNQVKECQLCGQSILFVERREGGLWFPTDAKRDEEIGSWGYISRGSRKEVALLHKCYGDPQDPSTVNGRRAICAEKIKSIKEKIDSLRIRYQLARGASEVDEFKASPEYKSLMDEYAKVREEFSDIL